MPRPPQALPAVETASWPAGQEQDEQMVTLQRLLVLQLRTAYLHSSVINASMVAYYGCLLVIWFTIHQLLLIGTVQDHTLPSIVVLGSAWQALMIFTIYY